MPTATATLSPVSQPLTHHIRSMLPTKTIFKSKTAFAAALTAVAGALGTISDPFRQFLADNAPAILICVGLANVALRFVTHGRVALFAD